MSRILQMAAVLALAAANLPDDHDEKPRRGLKPIQDPILPQHGPDPDPEGERIKAELRERRRQNFLRQKKS
jgi:hypothetical protein